MNRYKWESLFFLFFGLFHIHRIWAFIDAQSYNSLWLNILENRNTFFYILGILLIIITVIAILFFIKEYKSKKWWRWIYLFGGTYVLIDSILNLLNINIMKNIIMKMYTLKQPYYNILWIIFIIIGVLCIFISIYLWKYKENILTEYTESNKI